MLSLVEEKKINVLLSAALVNNVKNQPIFAEDSQCKSCRCPILTVLTAIYMCPFTQLT